ncbi:MAG: hypothetical protein ACTSX0_13300, partial [Promethearchaeota archaeon]
GKTCKWCGSDKFLAVHHNYNSKFVRDAMKRKIVSDLIKKKMDSKEIEQQFKIQYKYKCPKCGYIITLRKYGRGLQKTATCPECIKKSEIRIDERGNEYILCDSIKIIKENIFSEKELNYYLDKDKFKGFLKTYNDEIERLLNEAGAPPPYDYYDFERNCIVLCRKCHYATEHGMDLCPVCKKKYKKKKYDTCFDCLPEDRKKKIIDMKIMQEKQEMEFEEF